MSVELRFKDDARLECDWGAIDNPGPDRNPYREDPQHLMLITPDFAAALIVEPKWRNGATTSISREGARVFVHLERDDHKRWIWELFEAYWEDGKGPEILIGRWPD